MNRSAGTDSDAMRLHEGDTTTGLQSLDGALQEGRDAMSPMCLGFVKFALRRGRRSVDVDAHAYTSASFFRSSKGSSNEQLP